MSYAQEEELAAAARKAVLPPLQSVMELTSAYKPPTRQFEAVEAGAAQAQAAPEVGRQLEDGSGVLADGTKLKEDRATAGAAAAALCLYWGPKCES
eukprot:1160720-Pelagomonas_calceolata.AAC.17